MNILMFLIKITKECKKNYLIIEQHNIVNEVDYNDLYHLRREISSKIHSLKNEIRKILEKIKLKKN